MGTTPFIPDYGTSPSPLDLTTLNIVKSVLALKSGQNDAAIQLCISAAGVEWIRRTDRGPEAAVPLTSPFVQPVLYTETYDGSGSERLVLKQWPVLGLVSVAINGIGVQPATSFSSSGIVIDETRKSIVYRNGFMGARGRYLGAGYRRSCGGFPEGIQNVAVTYGCGFLTQADGLAADIGAGDLSLTLAGAGLNTFNGAYIRIETEGSANEEYVLITGGGGTQTLGIARAQFGTDPVAHSAGAQIAMPGVPADIVRACTQMVAINYRRFDTSQLDMSSKSIASAGQTGTTTFRSWEIPPEVASVIKSYKRNVAA